MLASTMVQLFSVPTFFIFFEETLKASIILSVMLTLINNIVEDRGSKARMKKKVWVEVWQGVGLSTVATAIFLSLYYTVAKQAWGSASSHWGLEIMDVRECDKILHMAKGNANGSHGLAGGLDLELIAVFDHLPP
ncbi:hypothetical protein GOP47_0017158 [Adiantum capillus-veneris]|uniref:Uncharacterized protein n=1 Tax=Adiantum capillus-veneris TaxID=13818 RepID=A0A9D4ZAZ7_ADICA|nr:hypothetical protein GOP47_0017158 [Adiantum capillus-veneris]